MNSLLKTAIAIVSVSCVPLFAEWKVDFDEQSSSLRASDGAAKIEGALSFSSGGKNWKVAASRDGVKNRLAIVDHKGDVQGYIVFPEKSGRLEIFFYHRTAQAYKGRLAFGGQDSFRARRLRLPHRRAKGRKGIAAWRKLSGFRTQ